jgi:hypothetical protein
MAKCKVEGCRNDAGINPKTGRANSVCMKHFLENRKSSESRGSGPSLPKRGPAPKKKAKEAAPKVELFVLRGRTLTINYTGYIRHHEVDRFTRAVKYNDESTGTSGKTYRYVVDIKQGNQVIGNVLFGSKADRDREFAKLQALLSNIY